MLASSTFITITTTAAYLAVRGIILTLDENPFWNTFINVAESLPTKYIVYYCYRFIIRQG